MSGRGWAVLLVLACAVGWWFSPVSPRTPHVPAAVDGATTRCVLPPRVVAGDAPLQTPVPVGMAPIRLAAATLTPVAGFSLDARVLSRLDYSLGREADLSPLDLAVGWGPMREPAVLDQLDLDQGGRFYTYRWTRPLEGVTAEAIAESSANMHLIPADAGVARALGRLAPGARVRLDGWLVNADAPDGWHWRTSTTRADTGAGACELVYVCAVTAM